VLHFNVTEHPTAAWTAQQMVAAFEDRDVLAICCGIGIGSTATKFVCGSRRWAAKKFSPERAVLGRIYTPNV
jgi:hypothetical protein